MLICPTMSRGSDGMSKLAFKHPAWFLSASQIPGYISMADGNGNMFPSDKRDFDDEFPPGWTWQNLGDQMNPKIGVRYPILL